MHHRNLTPRVHHGLNPRPGLGQHDSKIPPSARNSIRADVKSTNRTPGRAAESYELVCRYRKYAHEIISNKLRYVKSEYRNPYAALLCIEEDSHA